MRKKQTDEPDTIVDPAYQHLMPEDERHRVQTELEDTLEAALDEASLSRDEQFWKDLHVGILARVEALEKGRQLMCSSCGFV